MCLCGCLCLGLAVDIGGASIIVIFSTSVPILVPILVTPVGAGLSDVRVGLDAGVIGVGPVKVEAVVRNVGPASLATIEGKSRGNG